MSRITSRVGGAVSRAMTTGPIARTAAFSTRALAKAPARRRTLILHTTARRGHANIKPGCSTCLYRHECFPAHFALPPIPAPAEAAVRGFWANPNVRRLLPATLFAVSAMGTGLLIWSEHERLAALSERYLGQDVFKLLRDETTATTLITEHDRQHVWDMLSTRPEILNSFLFCSCGCGEKVDFHNGQFEMKSGRVFTRSHFRCDGCGKQLQGTSGAADHHHHKQQGREEDGWVFDRNGKLYCVYDFMDKFCHTCSGCGHELGDQLAVDPRLGAAFCVDCFEHSTNGQSVEHFGVVERVESQSQADKLMREVRQWLSQEMGLEFAGADGDIPLSLYRSEKIEQLKAGAKNSKKEGTDEMGSTLGLTVKQASRHSIFSKKTYTPKEVILVKGLSTDHAGAVLAHEMMHCWIALYLSQTSQLPEEVEEGLCELMSYFWLVQKQNQTASTTTKSTQSEEMRSEVGYLLGRMERNWDNAQGRGFHRALNSLQAQEDGNLRLLLAHARQHADFPTALPSL